MQPSEGESPRTSVASETTTRRDPRRVILILGLVSLFTDVGTEMVFAVLPLFLVGQLGVTMAAVGLIEGVAEATAALLKLGSGVLADRTGRPKALALTGYGLSALTKPLFALAPGIGLVVAARWLDRVGKGIRAAPRDVLLASMAVEGRRGRAFGLRQTLDKLGEASGPLAASLLLTAFPGGYRLVFALACLPGLAALLLLALGVPEAPRPAVASETEARRGKAEENAKTRKERSTRTDEEHPPGLGSSSSTSRTSLSSRLRVLRREPFSVRLPPFASMTDLRRLGPGFRSPLAVAALLGLASFSDAFLLLRARDLGMTMALIPLVLLAMNLGASSTAYLGGAFADARGHRAALGCGIALYAAACAALAIARSPAWVWPAALVLGLHLAFVRGNLMAWVSNTVPPSDRGTALGWVHLVQGLALLPASLVAGWLWQHAGPTVTFAVAALVAAGALPLLRSGGVERRA